MPFFSTVLLKVRAPVKHDTFVHPRRIECVHVASAM